MSTPSREPGRGSHPSTLSTVLGMGQVGAILGYLCGGFFGGIVGMTTGGSGASWSWYEAAVIGSIIGAFAGAAGMALVLAVLGVVVCWLDIEAMPPLSQAEPNKRDGPDDDPTRDRLNRAGWSVTDAPIVTPDGHCVWVVTGHNGETVLRAYGVTRPEAWQQACEQAAAGGMLVPKQAE